ncbi:TetR/AcrR family transcriptional regulator [Saccharothrix syringae]|uniref:TetR/AcrR family transcriptional regulator n=1 Tax=Saccharothrix syringae TaxID=103733 RepID=UPI00068B99F7|nr:TetR/AcrR family transcriptional regulator [Saccharothrix syringae]
MNDPARGARTRAALVAASIELFDRHGYEATSLEAVCRHVSVTKGALYRHFPSKQALAVAVVEEYFDRWHEVRAELEEGGAGPMRVLVALTERMGLLVREDRTVRVGVRLLYTSELFDLVAGVHFACLSAVVRDLLVRAAAAGEVVPGTDVPEEADGFTAAVIGAQAMSVVAARGGRPAAPWRRRLARLATPQALAPSAPDTARRSGGSGHGAILTEPAERG